MGCGSSSLKGEKVEDIKPTSSKADQPIKRIRTNFSDVDFSGEQGSNGARRPTVALAPDEQRRPTKISEVIEPPGLMSDPISGPHPPQQPYKDADGLASPIKETPVTTSPDTTTTDPPSSVSGPLLTKKNNPENNQHPSQTEEHLLAPEDKSRRKSWLGRLIESRRDKSMDISDEELKRTVGMTRAEFEEWKTDPKNKVGPRQGAADHSVAGSSLGAAAVTGF